MMYMVIRYTNCLEPEDYGVNDDWSLILLTSDKEFANKVKEKEENNKEFEKYRGMSVKIIEVDTEKVYKPNEEIQIGCSFILSKEVVNMKKQYTKEYAYDRNIKITFYENGVKAYFTIMSEWKVDGYLSAKHEDGWVEAYSQEQYDENEKTIQELLDDLEWRQKWREEMKGNLIKEV